MFIELRQNEHSARMINVTHIVSFMRWKVHMSDEVPTVKIFLVDGSSCEVIDDYDDIKVRVMKIVEKLGS